MTEEAYLQLKEQMQKQKSLADHYIKDRTSFKIRDGRWSTLFRWTGNGWKITDNYSFSRGWSVADLTTTEFTFSWAVTSLYKESDDALHVGVHFTVGKDSKIMYLNGRNRK